MQAVHEMPQTCPYLDLADVRCSSRLTMKSLAEAYRLCFGDPQACPVHQLLTCERSWDAAELAETATA